MTAKNAPITVTEKALNQIKHLINTQENKPYGIRIALKTKGCTGLSYALSYAQSKEPFDEELVIDQIHILIDSKAVLYILGTVLDYKETDIESGFSFENPNEKGRCGCGKSFHV